MFYIGILFGLIMGIILSGMYVGARVTHIIHGTVNVRSAWDFFIIICQDIKERFK